MRNDDLTRGTAHQDRPLTRSERVSILIGMGSFMLGFLVHAILAHWAAAR